jgi:hypothetical protein
MFKLLITVWISGHPVAYPLPHIYTQMDGARECKAVAKQLLTQVKPGVRLTAVCVPTKKREA